MSLRGRWYVARQQREQEVRSRQQQVLEQRQQHQAEMAALHEYNRTTLSQFHQNLVTDTAEYLYAINANRTAMAAAQRDWLNNFHSSLQANVAEFREETRSQQRQDWNSQAGDRAAYVAAMRDYVWGSAPNPPSVNIRSATGEDS